MAELPVAGWRALPQGARAAASDTLPQGARAAASDKLPRGARAAASFFESAKGEDGWTGGDGTYSIPLRGGGSAWLFGDSFIGGVLPDGSRSQDPRTFVRTSLVLERGGHFSTVTGHEDGAPVDLVRPPGAHENRNGLLPDSWYWPGHGTTRPGPQGDELVVMLNRFSHPPGSNLLGWDWQYGGTDVATLEARTGAVREQRALLPASNVLWGAALLNQGAHTYMYGSAEPPAAAGADAAGRQVHVARAPRDQLTVPSAWRFWDGHDWAADPARAAPIGASSSTQFGVVQARDGSLLLASQIGFDHAILGWRADRPEGPFRAVGQLARIPELPEGRHAYNAVPHPQLAPGSDDLVFSYNVGGADFLAREDSYRPGMLVAPGALGPRRGSRRFQSRGVSAPS